MKHALATVTAICSLVSLTSVPRAEAGAGGRSIRVDQENGSGCMSTYTTVATSVGATPTSITTSPGGAFTPGGGFANSTSCSAPSGSYSVLFPDGSPNGAAFFGGGSPLTSPYLATSGQMYQFFSGPITSGGIGNIPVTQVAVWGLTNGPFGASETEIELNGWCSGGSGASFKFDGNTYAGGCSSASPDDLLFSKTGSIVGYVTEGSNGTQVVALTSTLVGWTENGAAISGGGSSPVGAPEIDPSSAGAALTLLIGGLAVLRGGRRTLTPVR